MGWLLFSACIVLAAVFEADAECHVYASSTQMLMANETQCHIRKGIESNCYDCAPLGWNCCDDGSSTTYDPFCRYPSECCAEKYCGNQCCNSTHGVQCGPLCAPKAYSCCNTNTGQLCKKPDTCCGDHCCPDTHFCCDTDDVCCEKGSTCCPGDGTTRCCPPGTECCGDHCCPNQAHEQCKSGEVCCPEDRTCGDHLCCPVGMDCPDNTCCPQDGDWCGATKRCCHSKCHCNSKGGCCPSGESSCDNGALDDCHGSGEVCCSDGGVCPSSAAHCAGDYCCPDSHPRYCTNPDLCHGDNGGNCQCCGAHCCYPPYSCSGGECQYCYKTGHWWWRHTVCDSQGSYATNVNAVQKTVKQNPCHTSGSPAMAAVPRFLRHIRPQKVVQDPQISVETDRKVKPRSASMKTGVVLPPAPTKIRNPNSFKCFHDKTAMQDPCQFFSCLREMTDCGSTGYITDTISLYCTGVNHFKSRFTASGQDFLKAMTACITNAHLDILNQGIIPCCSALEDWGTGPQQEDCFLEVTPSFCDVFMGNAANFDKLFIADGSVAVYDMYFKYCNIGHEDRKRILKSLAKE